MFEGRSLLHRDDGLARTKIARKRLADLELDVLTRFLLPRGSVLDVGCGHGRACLHLQQTGFDAIGIDLDLRTLQEARMTEGLQNCLEKCLLADGRWLPFRDQSFDYCISLASTLSEKHRFWMSKKDRISIIREAFRVTRPNGLVLVNFVHRYWSFKGFLAFLKHYCMWITEKAKGKRTELGDYLETIGQTPIRFHAFTIREAKALFPKGDNRLEVWRGGRGLFTDWFFIIARRSVCLSPRISKMTRIS